MSQLNKIARHAKGLSVNKSLPHYYNHVDLFCHWHGSTVRQILEREIYTGCLVAQKTSTISPTTIKRIQNRKEDWIIRENTHEPIISIEDFDLVQQLIKSRKKHVPNKVRIYLLDYLFATIAVLGCTLSVIDMFVAIKINMVKKLIQLARRYRLN